jgi:hypothetical protein
MASMYVCRRLNLGRIRKRLTTQEQPGNPAEHSQLVCRTKNLQDQSRPRHPKNPTRFRQRSK